VPENTELSDMEIFVTSATQTPVSGPTSSTGEQERKTLTSISRETETVFKSARREQEEKEAQSVRRWLTNY